jgi:xylulokinase
LQATATDLESKLGNLAPAYGVAGNIASYFVERFVSLIFVSPLECM